jgi:hypothetical protein
VREPRLAATAGEKLGPDIRWLDEARDQGADRTWRPAPQRLGCGFIVRSVSITRRSLAPCRLSAGALTHRATSRGSARGVPRAATRARRFSIRMGWWLVRERVLGITAAASLRQQRNEKSHTSHQFFGFRRSRRRVARLLFVRGCPKPG